MPFLEFPQIFDSPCSPDLEHRQVKYLNNIIESDHGKLKRLIKPTLGFKSMKSAYATLKGFEVMRMFKKRQFNVWLREKRECPKICGNSKKGIKFYPQI